MHSSNSPFCHGIPEVPWNSSKPDAFLNECQQQPFDLAIHMHGDGSFINPFLRSIPAHHYAGFRPDGEIRPETADCLQYPADVAEIERHLRLMKSIGIPRDGSDLEFPLTAADDAAYAEVAVEYGWSPKNYVCVHPGARWQS